MSAINFQATSPTVSEYSNGDRAVRFIAMQHIAPPVYYETARSVLRAAQVGGYVHYYEFIDLYALDELEQRKIRKLTQFLPMPDVYARLARDLSAQAGTELEAQHAETFVGLVNDRDVNADISPQEFLARIEATIGPIELTDEDMTTPLSEPVSGGIPAERWMGVVLGSRNAHLARCVHESEHDRIVITFGAAHEVGWLDELQRRDARWQRSVAARHA